MSDCSDYEYEYDEENDESMEIGSNRHDHSVSISYETTLNTMVSKYRKLATDISVSVKIEEIQEVIEEFLLEISELFDVDRDAALALLIHFQWNKETLQEKYFADSDQVLIAAGIQLNVPPSPTVPTTCKICDSDISQLSELAVMNCSHYSCVNCFSQYLHHQVTDGIICIRANCLEYKCKVVVPSHMFTAYLEDKDLHRYTRFVVDDFVKSCKRLRWCTSPTCDLILVATTSQAKSVRCSCSQCCCFQCGEEGHEPASCQQTAFWLEKCSEDFPSKKWILLNTKSCPQCKEHIEKNQGCNHMTCRKCKYEFCWICLGIWSEHNDNYKCNKPTSEVISKDKDKLELEQYVHYFERYHGHGKAMEFAKEQMIKMKIEIDSLDATSKDRLAYLHQAIRVLDTVVDCRRILKYTYVMGCFLDTADVKKSLFEYQQEMLEKNTELLSQYTEESTFVNDKSAGISSHIVNLRGVTENFKNLLLTSMEDGKLLDANQV